ncbi:sacsin N-terminal ATP-binding-like domain-containing protein [Gordonia sp. DT219]|uniref:sacsin N-terminal ATP-binding-like domain-containing protein n=1 Tax=Gordonia sp. DT219 TaxID=3416658 RepID=UPI003CE849B1
MSGPDPIGPDPFGTAAARAATLSAWRESPTRLAEDVAAEVDLASVGYRDRLFVELVTNAADAARLGGIVGEVAIWADGDGVHIANTGAPLTDSGVRSLLALRVSAKVPDDTGAVIGRFGVGFTATAAVAATVEIRSVTGAIRFDRALTADAVADAGIIGGPRVPLLRLAWSSAGAPRAGFATEIVLGLAEGVVPADLLAAATAQAADLLLALPGLHRIAVADTVFEIDRTDRPDRPADGLAPGVRAYRLVVTVATGGGPAEQRSFTEVEHGPSRWLVADDGQPVGTGRDVLWAPTPTDIELSLPCRLIARLALTHDRRHIHPDADIASAAAGYVDLIRLAEPADSLALIPRPHRARGGDDARLIDAVLDELRAATWLPGTDATTLVPSRAAVLVGLSAELADVLDDVFADLVHPDLALAQHVPLLESLGVTQIGLAEVAQRLTGVERDAAWWGRLYAALAPLVATAVDVEELAALPIPRADGRMNIGARGLFTTHAVQTPLRWIRTVDPVADHPILERLGVQRLSVADALADPVLQTLVEEAAESVEDGDGADSGAAGLADEVLALIVADAAAPVPEWLSRLPLPTGDGEWRSADELLLADSPLATVLVDDHPFGLLDDGFAERFGADAVRRLGVGWGFSVVRDELPTGPDHELPDEEQWWDASSDGPEAPETFSAVRDLDLVDPDRWPTALSLIVGDESSAQALGDRGGYTAWWLRHFAEVDGLLLGEYRAPSDMSLAGVLDPLDHPLADTLAPALAALPPESADEASLFLARVGDEECVVAPGVARGIYAAMVASCRSGAIGWADIDDPGGVRVVSGGVAGTQGVTVPVILDEPWWAQAVDPDLLVVGPSDAEAAGTLADILDLPPASEEFTADPIDAGTYTTAASTEVVLFSAETGRSPAGEVRIHDDLRILLSRNGSSGAREVRVRWWVDRHGVTHLSRRRD